MVADHDAVCFGEYGWGRGRGKVRTQVRVHEDNDEAKAEVTTRHLCHLSITKKEKRNKLQHTLKTVRCTGSKP